MIIAFASGKGGTGKTAISTNFSAFLSETNPDNKVRLLDLDVEEPNSGLFFQGQTTSQTNKYRAVPQWEPEACIECAQCVEVCNFNAIIHLPKAIVVFPTLCHSCYACSELCPTSSLPMSDHLMGASKQITIKDPELEFIETKLDIGEESATPLIRAANKHMQQTQSKSTHTIIDAPPGTSCSVIEATELADFIVLVTEPTPFGLHDLKLAIRLFRELKKNFAVIINKAGFRDEMIEDYCHNENIKIIAKLPHVEEFAHLYSNGKLFYNHNRLSKQFFSDLKTFFDTEIEVMQKK